MIIIKKLLMIFGEEGITQENNFFGVCSEDKERETLLNLKYGLYERTSRADKFF